MTEAWKHCTRTHPHFNSRCSGLLNGTPQATRSRKMLGAFGKACDGYRAKRSTKQNATTN